MRRIPRWLLGWFLCWGFWGESAYANQNLQVQIAGLSTSRAYAGGYYRLFLHVAQAQKPVSHLLLHDMDLKVDHHPHALAGFGLRRDWMPLKMIVLTLSSQELPPETLEVLPKAAENLVTPFQEMDDLLFAWNETSTTLDFIDPRASAQSMEAWKYRDSTLPLEEIVTEYLPRFDNQNQRQVLLVLLPESLTWANAPSEAQARVIQRWLALRGIFLIVVAEGPETPGLHWWQHLAEQTHGRWERLEHFATELPERLQQIGQLLDEEYALDYHHFGLGVLEHEIELRIHAPQQRYILKKQIQPQPIWPHEQTLPLWAASALGLMSLGGLGFWFQHKQTKTLTPLQMGFRLVTPGEETHFLPLEAKSYTLDFLSSIPTKGNLRLSANLGKVVLVPQQQTFLLEDKNYKNALLINRRRVRRTLLQNGDILDVGELTVMFHTPAVLAPEEKDRENEPPPPTPEPIWMQFEKPRGPLRKGHAMLVEEASRQEYQLVKNITYIGHSETNDLILRGGQVGARHAKIVRIGSEYKLQDLGSQEGTFINHRRVEQRFLKDGDEISFENAKFRFRLGRTPMREERNVSAPAMGTNTPSNPSSSSE